NMRQQGRRDPVQSRRLFLGTRGGPSSLSSSTRSAILSLRANDRRIGQRSKFPVSLLIEATLGCELRTSNLSLANVAGFSYLGYFAKVAILEIRQAGRDSCRSPREDVRRRDRSRTST